MHGVICINKNTTEIQPNYRIAQIMEWLPAILDYTMKGEVEHVVQQQQRRNGEIHLSRNAPCVNQLNLIIN